MRSSGRILILIKSLNQIAVRTYFPVFAGNDGIAFSALADGLDWMLADHDASFGGSVIQIFCRG